MMAAVSSAKSGDKTVLIEKNSTPGKKLLMTGNGRCNLTRFEFDIQQLVEPFGENSSFLYSAFSSFDVQEVMNFFEELGVETTVEEDGRIFPESNEAGDVLQALLKKLEELNVTILTGSCVKKLNKSGDRIQSAVLKDGREIEGERFIICTGGKSYPNTGSTGDGYNWAKSLGHKTIKPMPALAPIKIKEPVVKDLQGLSLNDVRLTLIQKGKEKSSDRGSLIFTHFGISGPVVLNISGHVGGLLKKGEVQVRIDLKPDMNDEELEDFLKNTFRKNQNRNIEFTMKRIFPRRIAEFILNSAQEMTEKDYTTPKQTDVNSSNEKSSVLRGKSKAFFRKQEMGIKNKKINQLTRPERQSMVKIIKDFRLTVEEVCDFNYAMVTSGGIDTSQVDPKTMKSKIIDNLYFAGEILDLQGPTGGYNLQMCWSTGFVAGRQ